MGAELASLLLSFYFWFSEVNLFISWIEFMSILLKIFYALIAVEGKGAFVVPGPVPEGGDKGLPRKPL